LDSLDIEREQVDVASGKGMGYKYFGAAKQLPGVKELFELPPELKKKRSRYEMYKRIDADYYGYRDDEDGILEKLEQVAEKQMRAQAIEEWQQIEAVKNEARKGVKSGEVTLSPLLFCTPF
jgi:pre-mRNA-splicing factor ISY1